MNFNLKIGATGQETKRMQSRLNVDCDGRFGSKTEDALKVFQKNNGISQDGVYGLGTQTKMGTQVWPGVDVSHHNGSIDWKRVAETQKFAIVKLTEGRNFKDRNGEYNYKSAKDAGLSVGAYHFGRPDSDVGPSDPQKEAEHFVSQLNIAGFKPGIDLAPVLDLESGTKSDSYNVDWALKFCESIKLQTGVNPIIYTAAWFYNSDLVNSSKESLEKLKSYKVWWANYTTNFQKDPNLKLWDSWDIWQWTGRGTVAGISGRVDCNWLPGGDCGLRALAGG